jgi:WD40 repeat protein
MAGSGACAAAATRDQRTTVWDLASGARRLDIAGRALPDPSCRTLVVALPDGQLEGRSLQDGRTALWSQAPAGGPVTAWATDATGTFLAVAYAGGRLQVREVKDGRVRAERADPSAVWRYVRFSADGQALIAIDRDSLAHRWDASNLTGTPRTMRCTDVSPEVFAISPDLHWCAGGGPGRFALRDLTREDAQTIDLGTDWILALDFSPDGRTLMAGLQGGGLRFWPVDALVTDGERAKPGIWSEHRSDVTAVAYAPDGSSVISADRDRTVVMWRSPASGRLVSETTLSLRPTAVASDANTGRLAVGTSAGDVLVSHDGSPSSFENVANVGGAVTALALGATREVVVGTQTGQLFAVGAGSPPRPLSAEPHAAAARIRLSDDQTRAAVMFADGSVKIWNVATGQLVADVAGPGQAPVAVGEAHTGADVVFEPGGPRVALVRGGQQAYMWDARSSQVSPLPYTPITVFTSVAAAGAGGPLALGTGMYDEEIVLLDPAQAATPVVRLATQNLQTTAVTALAFSPDNRVLFSGHFSGTTLTWDIAGRRRFGEIHRARGAVIDLSYARDGSAVTAVTNEGVAIRWNVDPADWLSRACAIANRNLSPEEASRFLGATASRTCP